LNCLKIVVLKISNGKKSLISQSHNFPIEILHLRDDDIPQYVNDGTADLGILGENVLIESKKEATISKKLGFSKCRLSLAIPKGAEYTGPSYFEGKKIATTYKVILEQYLEKNGISASIHSISGSVEIAPNIGLADGICDIVSTGSTLFSNGLKEVETILKSEAVLISNSNLSAEKKEILERLIFRINAVNEAQNNKYVVLNAPNTQIEAIKSVLPGMKSPTLFR
jgi:ATP phosphoribosyltransferase (homohexameric) (EC 2.4.2.17)